MPTKTTRRKANTSRKLMVYNPAGGRQLNGSRRRKHVTHRRKRRSNPVTSLKAASTRRRSNPRRSSFVRNPAGITGLASAALMTALGLFGINLVTSRLLPAQSATAKIATKLGIGWVVQSYGNKIPVIGKYNREIALVFFSAGILDVLNQYLAPVVNNAIASVTQNLLPASASSDGSDATMQGLYGNAGHGYPVSSLGRTY